MELSLFSGPAGGVFLFAGFLLLGLLALEVLGLLVGGSLFGLVDDLVPPLDVPEPDAFTSLLHWFMLGKVPAVAVITLLLGGFLIGGIAFQLASSAILGTPVAAWATLPAAVAFAVFFSRFFSRLLGRYLEDKNPPYTLQDLLGLEAVIDLGRAVVGQPTTALVRPPRGGRHYVLVEPVSSHEVFTKGQVVVLESLDSRVFKASPRVEPEQVG